MFSNYLRHLIFQISFHYVFSVNFVGISRSWLCSFVLRLTKQQQVKLYFDRLKYKIFSIEPTEPFETQHSRNDLLIVFKHDHLLKFLLIISHWFWTLLFRAVNKIWPGEWLQPPWSLRLYVCIHGGRGVMVFNATFNNISVISWWSVLLVEETGENHWPVKSYWQTLSHNVVSSTPHHERFELTMLVVIGTDCTGSCKSN
jgi:hypothetical protein